MASGASTDVAYQTVTRDTVASFEAGLDWFVCGWSPGEHRPSAGGTPNHTGVEQADCLHHKLFARALLVSSASVPRRSDDQAPAALEGRSGGRSTQKWRFLPFSDAPLNSLPSSSIRTSFRLRTAYPGGSVPSFSMRIGQRSHRGLELQHSLFGRLISPAMAHPLRRVGSMTSVVNTSTKERQYTFWP